MGISTSSAVPSALVGLSCTYLPTSICNDAAGNPEHSVFVHISLNSHHHSRCALFSTLSLSFSYRTFLLPVLDLDVAFRSHGQRQHKVVAAASKFAAVVALSSQRAL